jgi:hypothetical protein
MNSLTSLEALAHKESDLNDIKLVKDEVQIEDIAWDPYEPNILVTFADGSISLITY